MRNMHVHRQPQTRAGAAARPRVACCGCMWRRGAAPGKARCCMVLCIELEEAGMVVRSSEKPGVYLPRVIASHLN